MSPRLMLFDEPTSALDTEMIKEVLEVMTGLVREGMTMIGGIHEMGFAPEVADEVVFMDQDAIVEKGGTRHLLLHAQPSRCAKLSRHAAQLAFRRPACPPRRPARQAAARRVAARGVAARRGRADPILALDPP
jgi:energy-coupling factor transporter ATP-binding protein EcfA2